MSAAPVESWLEGLGYSDQPEFLHRRGDVVPPTHPYALEIHALLQGDGSVRARAVFDVEGVPTIVFLDDDANSGVRVHALDDVRKRIWNQNLATIVLHVRGKRAVALPARKLESAESEHSLRLEEVRRDGPFSASECPVGQADDTSTRIGSTGKPVLITSCSTTFPRLSRN